MGKVQNVAPGVRRLWRRVRTRGLQPLHPTYLVCHGSSLSDLYKQGQYWHIPQAASPIDPTLFFRPSFDRKANEEPTSTSVTPKELEDPLWSQKGASDPQSLFPSH
ncbi:hypothetical protein VNO77_37755 [Canavalia gladiata]|uniref:Uncharacterized protein n=1 Tax=Canavalia gladiata TaxID=3824 RepID=A0AAN9KAC2_CANGL